MKKRDVVIGGRYIAKVSGNRTTIRITDVSPYGGWLARNLKTDRIIRIRTAGRLSPARLVDPENP